MPASVFTATGNNDENLGNTEAPDGSKETSMPPIAIFGVPELYGKCP